MKCIAALIVVLPLIVGCGKSDVQRNIEVEQEKLTLDLMKSQREQLAALTEREKTALAQEKKNEEMLREVEIREAQLRRSSKELEDHQTDFKNYVARCESELQSKHDALQLEQEQVKKSKLEAEASRRDVAEKFANLQRVKDAENEAKAKADAEAKAKAQSVFKTELAEAMTHFRAINGRTPKSQKEFMEEIVGVRGVHLPELPLGDRYIYDPATGAVVVGHE